MKEPTYINTLDGRTKIDWWEKEDFSGRVNRFYTADSAKDLIRGVNLELVHAIPIPDDKVVCDFCNLEITEYPIPVVGSYAMCNECFEGIEIKGG